jgi:phosphomannomutase
VYDITGRLYSIEESLPSTSDMRVAIPRRLRQVSLDHIGGLPVTRVSHLDGTKFYLENDNWALLRFSGTEPVLRLFVEADSPEKARELSQWLMEFVKKDEGRG